MGVVACGGVGVVARGGGVYVMKTKMNFERELNGYAKEAMEKWPSDFMGD